MIGLQTGRVLVVDDDFGEAKPVLEALWRRGVATVYCDGQTLPDAPFSGIRLLFLDLNLQGLANWHAEIQNTVAVVKRLIDPRDRAVGILIWTKHTQDQQEKFEQALVDRFSAFQPLFIRTSDRFVSPESKMRFAEGKAPIDELLETLDQALRDEPAHDLLRQWEQCVHDATVQAVKDLSEAADTCSLLELQGALVSASGNVETASQALEGLFGALHQLLADSVHAIPVNEPHAASQQLLDASQDSPGTIEPAASRLNTILLTAHVDDADIRALPGSVYLVDQVGEHSPWRPTSKQRRAFIRDVFPQQRPEGDGADKETLKSSSKQYTCQIRALASEALPILVEISPLCDVANNKRQGMRFLAGLLMPDSPGRFSKLAPSGRLAVPAIARQAYRGIPALVPSMRGAAVEGAMRLVISATRLLTQPDGWPSDILPVFRFREAVVTDIQAWFASHAARPGYYALC